MIRWATFDATRVYRYHLTRTWDSELATITWIMLNPSTADEHDDDPTISRVIGFSRKWGYGSAHVVNLFALRASSPTDLRQVEDPVGPANDENVVGALETASAAVVAWGNHGSLVNPQSGTARSEEMWKLLNGIDTEVLCLGLTARDQPSHPLYLPEDTKPIHEVIYREVASL